MEASTKRRSRRGRAGSAPSRRVSCARIERVDDARIASEHAPERAACGLQSRIRSATLPPDDKEIALKRRKTTDSRAPGARNARGPGKRAGQAKAKPVREPAKG